MNELQLTLILVLVLTVLSPVLLFLFFGQDKPKRKEELKKEQEIAKIYFSILNELEQKKYLTKYPELKKELYYD
tara:strand:+ start:8703 stop:8924 length:222 start_codon:yes stop_codon:yes gene_type:complete